MEIPECQGYLFKLKENTKEWKKLYVVLNGSEIFYYESPHDARAGKRMKDGVKILVSAHAYDEFDGFHAPTSSPKYLMIETTHAKKIYCAKSAEERALWLQSIKRGGEIAARSAIMGRRGGSLVKAPAPLTKGTSGFFGLFGTRARDLGKHSIPGRPDTSSGNVAEMAATQAAEVPDSQLNTQLRAVMSTLGMKDAAIEQVLVKDSTIKREMLRMHLLQQAAAPMKARTAVRAYVNELANDPTVDQVQEVAAWLRGVEPARLAEFVQAGGVDAIASVLDPLCRLSIRSDGDCMVIEAGMGCMKALIKDETVRN